MNAPANIRMPRAINLEETQGEVAYRRSISMHCPNCEPFEMAARVDIAIMRDQAVMGMSRASDSATGILSEVARLATHAVYAPFPGSKLIRIRSALHLAMEAARAIERVSRDG